MKSKATFAGHAIHPMLIVFPFGLFSTAAIFDVVYLITKNSHWNDIAFWMIASGLIGGVFAALAGAVDWMAIPSGTRAKRVGTLHGLGNVIVMIMFAASWMIRWKYSNFPSSGALGLSFGGIVLALGTGWLGGELVQRLGVSVDENANLNGSSSLSKTKEDKVDATG